MFIIKFILFIFLIGIFAVLFTIVRVWWKVREMQQRFRGEADDMGSGSSNQSTTSTGDIITDTRDPKRASRKIIDDDEGEYVEFEEEK